MAPAALTLGSGLPGVCAQGPRGQVGSAGEGTGREGALRSETYSSWASTLTRWGGREDRPQVSLVTWGDGGKGGRRGDV